MSRRTTVAAWSLLAWLLVGCGVPRTDPAPAPDAAPALRQRLGPVAVFAAALLVRVQPAQGASETFTLRLWADVDGAVRLRAQKLDIDFLDARVDAAGAYAAVLVRERVATSGRLGGADDPPLLSELRLLLSELRHGPLPPEAAVAAGADGAWRWADPLGWQAEMRLAGDGLPAAKTLADGAGEAWRLDYARWRAFEGLLRPEQVGLASERAGVRLTIRLRSLEPLPGISAERMRLEVPADAEAVSPGEFARRM